MPYKPKISPKKYYAFKEAYKLLQCLTDPQVTPRIPKHIRDAAMKCVLDYPIEDDLVDVLMAVDFWNPRK